jgi:hypothetical protein
MSSRPEDVGIRLSPQGLEDVSAALKRVLGDIGRTGREGAKAMSPLKAIASDLKTLLPTLGFAAAITGLIALGKNALTTADNTGKLQEKVGGTVEEISGLTLAFRTNQSDQAGLQNALLKTANVIQEVRANSIEAQRNLRAIGVDAQALAELSTPRALEEIARKLIAIEDPGQRSAAAFKIFGRESKQMITALNAVGKQGIDPFIAKARELGVLIDSELADAAAKAKDNMELIKIQTEGLATQFVAGFAPLVASAMKDFSEAIQTDGLNPIRAFGRIVGFIIRFVVGEFTVLGRIIGANVVAIGVMLTAVKDAVAAAATLDFSAAKKSFTDAFSTLSSLSEQLEKEKQEIRERVATPDAPIDRPKTAGGESSIVDFDALKAMTAERKQAAKDRIKIEQESLKAEESALKASYEARLISLQEYFDRRWQILKRNQALELEGLQAERAALVTQFSATPEKGGPENEAERIKIRQQIAQLDAQITTSQIQGGRELAELDSERAAAQKDLSAELLEQSGSLASLENRRHDAFQANLDSEILKIRQLGVQAGQTAEEIEANVKRLTTASTNQFNFDEIKRKADLALEAFDRAAEQIQRDQEVGIITTLDGERRLLELEKERIPALKEIAEAMKAQALALGDEESIAKAEAFAEAIRGIEQSVRSATDSMLQIRDAGLDGLEEGVNDVLMNLEEFETVEDVFKSLARTVAQSLRQIISEMIAAAIRAAVLRAILGSFAPSSSTGSSAAGSMTSTAPGVTVATGGHIHGPGTATSDSIPARLSDGEFVVRTRAVQQPGVLPFLHYLNRNMRFPEARRFAEGGLVGRAAPVSGPGQSGARFRIMNVLNPQMMLDSLDTPEGEEVVWNIIERQPGRARRITQS